MRGCGSGRLIAVCLLGIETSPPQPNHGASDPINKLSGTELCEVLQEHPLVQVVQGQGEHPQPLFSHPARRDLIKLANEAPMELLL